MTNSLFNPIFILVTVVVSILGFLSSPFLGALFMKWWSMAFRFQKQDYKTALKTSAIIFAIYVACSTLASLLTRRNPELLPWLSIPAFLITWVSGAFIAQRFYGEKYFRSLMVIILSGLCLLFIIFVMFFLVGLLARS